MALPRIEDKTYRCNLPLSKVDIQYRPFKVKDERILLMALQSNNFDEIVDAIKQIVSNAIIDDIDVNTMPIVDMEYLFVQLRMKSKGETSKVGIRCKQCNAVNPIEINLEDVTLTNEPPNPVIMITDSIGIAFRFPEVRLIHKAKDLTESVDAMFDIILDSIESVFDGDNVTLARDIEREELEEFVNSLSEDQFLKIKEFFQSIPTLKVEQDFKCVYCSHEDHIEIEGLRNFFG